MFKKTTRRRVVEEEVTEVVSLEEEKRQRMKYEQKRLDSFALSLHKFFVLDVSVAQRLAKAGFYCSLGNTECFSCGLSQPLSFWKEGHDPETVHREESPNCKFITGQSDNVSIREWMRYEHNRLDSFPSWCLDVGVAQRLAKAGFYYNGIYTVCFSCGLSKPFSLWREGHNPEMVHREESPDCEFVTGHSDNVTIQQERERREQELERMKYRQNRLDSFEPRWLDVYHLDVSVTQRLAKAGFYCDRYGSTVCFSCGLSKHVSLWREEYDPETVHREESPDCKFIISQSDNVPIDTKQQSKFESIFHPSLPSVTDKIKNQIKIDTGPNKEEMQPERKKRDNDTKTNQNRTEERTVSCTATAERKPRSKKRVPEKPAMIPSTSNFNVHQMSAVVTRSSSTAVSRETLISRRDTEVITSKTHQEHQTKATSESVKEKGVGATRPGSSDVNREKSATHSRSHWGFYTSNRNVTHTDRSENAVVTRFNNSAAGGASFGTAGQAHFCSDTTCSTVSSDKFR